MKYIEHTDKPNVVQVTTQNNLVDVYTTVGLRGPIGPQGLPGSQILSGGGAPESDLGAIGDYYLDTNINDLYGPKTQEDGWGDPVSLGTAQFQAKFDIEDASDEDVIMYDESSELWVPKQIRYRHVQTSPASTWIVSHNLGTKPGGVSIVDSADTVIIGDITYDSLNVLTIKLSSSFSGKAYIS